MSSVHRIAAVQMVSGPDVAANLAAAERLIGEAAAAGAGLVVLPEYFPLITADETAKLRLCEPDGEGPLQAFLQDAVQLKYADDCFVLTGTYTETRITDPTRDIVPDRTFMVRVEFKYLGDFRYKTNALDSLFATNQPIK